MTPDQREHELSQYADGTLDPDERAKVEAWLASDPAARTVVAEYRRLDAAFVALPAVPSVDLDALAGRVSAAIAGQRPAVAGRIGFDPVRRVAWWAGAAAAAGVAMVVGLRLMRPVSVRPPAVAVDVVKPAMVAATGPAAEVGAGAAEVQVSIGPSPAVAAAASVDGYAYGLSRHQSKVVLFGQVRTSASAFVPVR